MNNENILSKEEKEKFREYLLELLGDMWTLPYNEFEKKYVFPIEVD